MSETLEERRKKLCQEAIRKLITAQGLLFEIYDGKSDAAEQLRKMCDYHTLELVIPFDQLFCCVATEIDGD